MPFVDFYLKIKNKKQLENVFSKLGENSGVVWKNHWKDRIAPLTEKELSKWLEIEKLSNLEMFKHIEQYLKDHNYNECMSENWENSEFKVGMINCTKSLFEDKNEINKNIQIGQDPALNIPYIDNNEMLISVHGMTEKMPFKLISKICQQEDIVFLCKFDEMLAIKIDSNKIKYVNLTVESLQKDEMDNDFFALNILSEIEKKELALANMIISENIKCDPIDKIEILNSEDKENLINRICKRIENNDEHSLFKSMGQDFKTMCDRYFLHQKLQNDIILSSNNDIIEQDRKTKV